MSKKLAIWLENPEEHDFPAAADYLDLHFTKPKVENLVLSLRGAETIKKKAKVGLLGGLYSFPAEHLSFCFARHLSCLYHG